MGKKIILFILDHFADWEGAYISSVLLDDEITQGHEVLWASLDKKPKKSLGNMTMIPDLSLDEIPSDADALLFIGGSSWRSDEAKRLNPIIKQFMKQNKIIGFICDATYFAAKEGFLNHIIHTGNSLSEMKKLSTYTNENRFLRENAVLDKNIITANGNSPVDFAAKVLEALNILSLSDIEMVKDFYLLGYWNALKKYGYLDE